MFLGHVCRGELISAVHENETPKNQVLVVRQRQKGSYLFPP